MVLCSGTPWFLSTTVLTTSEKVFLNESLPNQALAFLLCKCFPPLDLPLSLFEVLFGLDDFNASFIDQEKTLRFLIQRVYREQLNNIEGQHLIDELQQKLPHIPAHWWQFDASYQPSPTFPTDLTIANTLYKTLGVVHSIGSPHDVGGNAIRVILCYPRNDAARKLFRSWR